MKNIFLFISILFLLIIKNNVRANSYFKDTTSPPNLLYIIIDQWRVQSTGYFNKEPVLTPTTDFLANSSLNFTQSVSNYPLCTPARATLMSGLRPLKSGVYSNANSETAVYGVELKKDTKCWSDILKENGYFNGYIGKWHLDAPQIPYVYPGSSDGSSYTGNLETLQINGVQTKNKPSEKKVAWNEWTQPNRRHGFEYWYAYGTYDVHNKPMYWATNTTRDGFHFVEEWSPIHETKKAIEFIQNKDEKIRPKNKPFALVVSFNPPHMPYNTAPKEYVDLYKNININKMLEAPNVPANNTKNGELYRNELKNYYANISGIDAQIFKLLQTLKEEKLDSNTLIVLISDHGNSLGQHNQVSKNHAYEEALRVPLLFYWKGKIIPQKDSISLINTEDVYPTILEIMGLKNTTPKELDGVSYAEQAFTSKRKKKLPTEQYIYGAMFNKKGISNKHNGGFRGIRTLEYKYFCTKNKDKTIDTFLYNLKKDRYEINNIVNEDKITSDKMSKILQSYLEKTGDDFFELN